MARVCAIACGHEDAIDLDRLRHDPLMKVAVGRCPQRGAPLASQSTISRLENTPRKIEAARLTAALVDQAGARIGLTASRCCESCQETGCREEYQRMDGTRDRSGRSKSGTPAQPFGAIGWCHDFSTCQHP
jgi:Transposase DDE domain group 1